LINDYAIDIFQSAINIIVYHYPASIKIIYESIDIKIFIIYFM